MEDEYRVFSFFPPLGVIFEISRRKKEKSLGNKIKSTMQSENAENIRGENLRECIPRPALKSITNNSFLSPPPKKSRGSDLTTCESPLVYYLPDHVWGVVLDHLTTCSASFTKPCTSSVATVIALSTLLERTVSRPTPQPHLDTPWSGKRRPLMPRREEPEKTPTLLLVCKSWTKLFQGQIGRARRPRAWISQVR